MISDHYMNKPFWQPPVTFPYDSPDARRKKILEWEEYEELARKAREYDRIHNQPDCIDPKKKEWEDAIRKIIREQIEDLAQGKGLAKSQ